MARQLHDSCFSGPIRTRDVEGAIREVRQVVLVEAIIAAKLLRRLLPAISLVSDGVRRNPDDFSFSHQRAHEPRHDERGRSGRRLFVFGLLYTQDVARILYQSMLEASSRSEERPAGFAGEPDAFERAEHAPVGARWGAPEGMEPAKRRVCRSMLELRCGDPFDFDRRREEVGGMLQGIIRRPVRIRGRIEIAYHTHGDFGVHQNSLPF